MKTLLFTILGVATLGFASCEPPIKGNGTPITEKRTCNNFNAVITDLPSKVHITAKPDTAFSCTITAQPNILPLIECAIEKDELLIRFKRSTRISSTDNIEINISMPTLNSLKVLGSGNGTIDGNLVSENLLCAMMGSGNIDVQNATIRRMRADITGSGNINLHNTVSINAEYAIKGSGNIQAKLSPADSVRAIVAGSGDIECMAVKNIDAEINGSGKIKYAGKPNISRSKIGGNGQIVAE
jgi:Putative auto-transporter adhesin, head GIN domain